MEPMSTPQDDEVLARARAIFDKLRQGEGTPPEPVPLAETDPEPPPEPERDETIFVPAAEPTPAIEVDDIPATPVSATDLYGRAAAIETTVEPVPIPTGLA